MLLQQFIVLENITANVTFTHLVWIAFRTFVVVGFQFVFAVKFDLAYVAFKVGFFVKQLVT